MSLPPLFLARMERLIGRRAEELNTWYHTPLATRGVRANLLKCTPERLQALFSHPLVPSPFAEEGFVTEAAFRAGSDPLHHAGAYYMQEVSAMSAVTALAPQAGERVLDLCAAPGGKTTQIAAALGHTGLVWANEYVPSRAKILAQNMERCGVRRGVVSCGDTAALAAALPQYFDAVLADVPCSGEGMFRKESEAVPCWSEENIQLCAERSTEILNNAAACVKAGGRLVISTCTFAPEENEWAVIRFLHTHTDFVLESAGDFGSPAFAADQVASFGDATLLEFARTLPLHYCRRIFPWDGGEGHFVAKLRRLGEGGEPTVRTVQENQKDEAVAAAKAVYADCFKAPPHGVFVRAGDTVRLVPEDMPVTTGVYVLAAGVAVAQGTVGRNVRWEPAHAVFQAAAAEDCRRVRSFKRDDLQLLAFLRGEELRVSGEDGWTGVAAEGILVGFGKLSGGRLKNRYPKGLRLLG